MNLIAEFQFSVSFSSAIVILCKKLLRLAKYFANVLLKWHVIKLFFHYIRLGLALG